MLEDSIYSWLIATGGNLQGVPVIPVGPNDTHTLDLAGAPVPCIVYMRHATNTELDMTGQVQCELIDLEVVIFGETFQQASLLAETLREGFDGQTIDGYEFTFFNQLSQAYKKSIATSSIVQYYQIFYPHGHEGVSL